MLPEPDRKCETAAVRTAKLPLTLLSGALFTTLWFVPTAAHAGGWTQPEGACYAKLGARFIVGNGAYQAQSLRDVRADVVNYGYFLTEFYGECGVHDQITAVIFGSPFGYASAGGADTAYIGPLGVAVRVDPFAMTGDTRFAFQLDYSYAPSVGEEILFEEMVPMSPNPRTFYNPVRENHYGQLTLQLGHGFVISDSVNGWFNIGAGVRLNSASDMDHAIIALPQLGFTFWDWFGFEIGFPLYEPFGAEVVETNISGAGQTRYLGIGLKFSAWFNEHIAAYVGLEGVAYASSNAATPTFIVGVESRFRLWGE